MMETSSEKMFAAVKVKYPNFSNQTEIMSLELIQANDKGKIEEKGLHFAKKTDWCKL